MCSFRMVFAVLAMATGMSAALGVVFCMYALSMSTFLFGPAACTILTADGAVTNVHVTYVYRGERRSFFTWIDAASVIADSTTPTTVPCVLRHKNYQSEHEHSIACFATDSVGDCAIALAGLSVRQHTMLVYLAAQLSIVACCWLVWQEQRPVKSEKDTAV